MQKRAQRDSAFYQYVLSSYDINKIQIYDNDILLNPRDIADLPQKL